MSETTGRPVLREIMLETRRDGDEMWGATTVEPGMWVPGTASLRTSLLALWTDTVAGRLALDLIMPRVPVTLDLDVHLYGRPPTAGPLHAVARPLKVGRSVLVLTVDFTGGDREPIAVGTASFMAAPDPKVIITPEKLLVRPSLADAGDLQVPLTERARCRRGEPGVAVLSRSEQGVNASDTVNGGLIALAIEEAALSLVPGSLLSSMALRYLRPVRVGPAVATARAHGSLVRVEVRDAGADDRLAVVATTTTA